MVAISVVALLGTPIASAQTGLTTATYEIDDEADTVTYSKTGPMMPVVDCETSWGTSAASVTNADEAIHKLVVRVDAADHEVGVSHWADGTIVSATYTCDEATTRPSAPAVGWRTETAASAEPDASLLPGPLAGTACDDDPTLSVDRLAPFSAEETTSTSAPADASPLCTQARAAAEVPEPERIPFTGHITATLTDDDGQQMWAETCMVVFGTCWDEGRAEVDLPDQRPDGPAEWTLSCEASPVFPAAIHAVGSFSCQAWLGDV